MSLYSFVCRHSPKSVEVIFKSGPMAKICCCFLFSVAILLVSVSTSSRASLVLGKELKSATFLSPMFVLGPGSVENRLYYNIDFPRGHIAIKSFNGEVIDEAGNPIPLHETYLHHWVVDRYYQRQGMEITKENREGNYISGGNSGPCPNLRQYFGLGSETRKTETYVPDPYGIEVGNPAEIPEGFEEAWMLNVHAIDTRGVEDRLGCTECRCDLYNVTVDEYGRPLGPGYRGGLYCCYDQTQCRVKRGFQGARRNLYLWYTVKWVDMDSSIIPVKIYIFDVTDNGKRTNDSAGPTPTDGCRVEYEVESCSNADIGGECLDNKRARVSIPKGGYVVYGVAHQHTGGIGSTLYGKDGRVICTSIPAYGHGEVAGDEKGYIVGMSTCYPKPGSVKIMDGEDLILDSNYSSSQYHSGVMGLFYVLVADQTPPQNRILLTFHHGLEDSRLNNFTLAIVALMGLAIVTAAAAAAVVVYLKKKERGELDYQPIVA